MRLDADERRRLAKDGFLLRTGVFSAPDVAAMIDASEALIAELVRGRRGRRLKVGSYVFDPDMTRGVMIKWEGESDIVVRRDGAYLIRHNGEAWRELR